MLSGECILDHNRYKVDPVIIEFTFKRAAFVTYLIYGDHDCYLALLFLFSNLLSFVGVHF